MVTIHDHGFTSHAIPVTDLGLLRVEDSEELCLLMLGNVSEIWRKQNKSRAPQLRDAVGLGPRLVWMSTVVLSCFECPPTRSRGETAKWLMTSSGVKQICLHGAPTIILLFLRARVSMSRYIMFLIRKPQQCFSFSPSMGWQRAQTESTLFGAQVQFQIVFFHNSGGFEHIFHWKCWFNR